METFSTLLALCAGNSPVTGEFPAQRPVMRNFDVSLIYVRINGWLNNREAGDFRRHRAHYDAIVMVGWGWEDTVWPHVNSHGKIKGSYLCLPENRQNIFESKINHPVL